MPYKKRRGSEAPKIIYSDIISLVSKKVNNGKFKGDKSYVSKENIAKVFDAYHQILEQAVKNGSQIELPKIGTLYMQPKQGWQGGDYFYPAIDENGKGIKVSYYREKEPSYGLLKLKVSPPFQKKVRELSAGYGDDFEYIDSVVR